MKKSIALAIAILALGVAPGLFQQKRLKALREDHRDLAAQAAKLGLAVEASPSSAEPRQTKRQREDNEKRARSITAEVIAFAKEMEAVEKSGDDSDEEFQKRSTDLMARLSELDAAQLKLVIAGLRDSHEISGATRGNIISFCIMTLAKNHPEAAVALYAESADLLDKSLLGDHVVSSALGRWAKLNPSAALDWVRKNADSHQGLTGDDAKRGVIAGIAENDPKLAFKLIGDLEVDDPESAIHAIVMTGHDSPERRDAVLAALRGHLAGIQDETEREELSSKALEMFARTAEKEGFDSLTSWMEQSKFTAKEKEQFAGGLSWFTTRQDTGRWVEWMGGNLPANELADPVREIVGEWTQQDYQAAGKWLSAAADGPAKTAAVEAYAQAVAEYEPQIAAQWAMTLPAGPARTATLRAVYQNWPAGDPQGAAAFAREHGLE